MQTNGAKLFTPSHFHHDPFHGCIQMVCPHNHDKLPAAITLQFKYYLCLIGSSFIFPGVKGNFFPRNWIGASPFMVILGLMFFYCKESGIYGMSRNYPGMQVCISPTITPDDLVFTEHCNQMCSVFILLLHNNLVFCSLATVVDST